VVVGFELVGPLAEIDFLVALVGQERGPQRGVALTFVIADPVGPVATGRVRVVTVTPPGSCRLGRASACTDLEGPVRFTRGVDGRESERRGFVKRPAGERRRREVVAGPELGEAGVAKIAAGPRHDCQSRAVGDEVGG